MSRKSFINGQFYRQGKAFNYQVIPPSNIRAKNHSLESDNERISFINNDVPRFDSQINVWPLLQSEAANLYYNFFLYEILRFTQS